MLRNLIFVWPGALAEQIETDLIALLFQEPRNPELLLEEIHERLPTFKSSSEIDSLLEPDFIENRRYVKLFPQALEFLRFCRNTRRRMFLLSSWPDEELLARFEIAHFFEHAYLDVMDTSKCLAEILATHTLVPEETACVAGEAQTITIALRAGLKTIAIGGDPGSPSDIEVRDLGQLQALLEPVPPNDEIRIEELTLYARVGVPDEERAEPQRLVLSANLQPRHAFDDLDDDLAHTVDYAAVCEELREFVRQRADRLIETLADAMAEHLLDHFDLQQVELELRKFVLPETRFVAVRLARSAPVRA
ncbi:MAG TPA: dihydroneopterin aldolase [Chthoniobacterales bacterium]|nr:dihydroneopterin aldolase [Chthoniobacterales bacterium]